MVSESYRNGVAGIIWEKKYSPRDPNPIRYVIFHRIDPWVGWSVLKGKKGGKTEIEALRDEMRQEAQIRRRDVLEEERMQGLRIKYEFPMAREKEYICIGQDLQVWSVQVRPDTAIRVDNIEHDNYYWTNAEKAKRMLTFEEHKTALEKTDERIRAKLGLARPRKL
jgi:hypothetical protein